MEDVIVKLEDTLCSLRAHIDELRVYYASTQKQPEPEPIVYEMITREQEDEIRHVCREYPDMVKDMLDHLRLEDLSHMPKHDYRVHIERLKKIVHLRDKASE